MASDNIARVKPNSGEHYRIGRSVTRSAGGTSGHVGVRFLKGIQHRTTSATSQKDEILWNQWRSPELDQCLVHPKKSTGMCRR